MAQSVFFAGIAQDEIAFREYRGRVPMFFRSAQVMGGVFLANLGAASARMPTPQHRVHVALPGRALVALQCFEYEQSDIGPYNEVSLGVAVHHGPGPLRSPARLIEALVRKEQHGFVTELPVTTNAAVCGGIEVLGYPKWLADIRFHNHARTRVCEVRDPVTGALVLRAEGRALPTHTVRQRGRAALETEAYLSYPVKDGTTLRARMLVNLIAHGRSFFRPDLRVTLGAHPRAEPFRALELGLQLSHLHAPRSEAILFRPQPIAVPS